MSSTLPAHLARQRGLRVPFDLRILRILFPAPSCQRKLSKGLATNWKGPYQ